MNNKIQQLQSDLLRLKNSKKAKILQGFFKTGKGEYGEGDMFLGITVPVQRKISQQYSALQLSDVDRLLASKIHEHRLVGLLILVHQYQKGDAAAKNKIYQFYLRHAQQVNNWDLVDLTAPNIVGAQLLDNQKNSKSRPNRAMLYRLAKSKNLWERRIAIVATHTFIRNNEFQDTLNISEQLLQDKHDLIHKACGWMLREVGKRDEKVLKKFLDKNNTHMPRTMLRYAIERFNEKERQHYLKLY
jgi:3-methyladenine DNA glycosylase AlkD